MLTNFKHKHELAQSVDPWSILITDPSRKLWYLPKGNSGTFLSVLPNGTVGWATPVGGGSETLTTLTFSSPNLLYKDEAGTTNTISLASLIPPTHVPVTTADSPSITLSGYGVNNQTLEASVNISAATGNDLSTNADGLFLDVAANETVTSLVGTVVGHLIGTYTNEAGGVATINETVTSVSYSTATKILTYLDESGNPTDIDLSGTATDIFVDGATYDAGTGLLTLTDNSGTTPDVTVQIHPPVVTNDSGSINFTQSGTDNQTITAILTGADTATLNQSPTSDGAGNIVWTSPLVTAARHDLRLVGTNIERGSDSATVTNGAEFLHDSYSHLVGFSDNWIGANGSTKPVLNLRNNGDIWAGGTTESDTTYFRFNKDFGTINLGTNILGNDFANSLAVGTDMPYAHGVNSIISGSQQNVTCYNSIISGANNYSDLAQYSSVSGSYNTLQQAVFWSTISGVENSIINSSRNMIQAEKAYLDNVNRTTTNLQNLSNIYFVTRGLLFGDRIQIGTGANAATTSYDVFTFGKNLTIGKSADMVLNIGDFNTVVESSTGVYVYGVNHNVTSGYSTTIGFNSVDFTGQTSNDIISTDYLEIYGNGTQSTIRSNVRTTLKNGSVQFNNTGFGVGLTQVQVTPKSALEVVSTTSGIIPPQLTDAAATARILEINTTPSLTKSLPGGWDDRIGETWFNLDLGTHERVVWNGTTYIKQTY